MTPAETAVVNAARESVAARRRILAAVDAPLDDAALVTFGALDAIADAWLDALDDAIDALDKENAK